MKSERPIKRREFLKGAAGAAGALAVSGCDNLTASDWFPKIMHATEHLTGLVQGIITPADALAKEYTEADISSVFPANGNTDPGTAEYAGHMRQNFSKWTVEIGGLVDRPHAWSLVALKAMPARTQITRHDCVEGWSAIGKWTGVPLGDLLRSAGPRSNARYVMFHCADIDDQGISYYESMALADCFHPQTILAYDLNGRSLDVAHGAPLRLRVERQLGYKHAKYVAKIVVVDTFEPIGGGKGGYWEDQGYEWYAGI
ncbi:molybdopterin oxidoreductase [Nitrospira sp. KM1]|uniref:molybdopterin-dependent oxidoreductase n=1 Tax=Nitrospira sp. KM1 TaxID=1936990 RepID=UPI0013A71782|nr:molybdopterin-dependent oxidoreductase [Nitrospira sp. KM1]BCA54559.1 molybdopterin oxidoreductase [Nitrospira sp. KM1]